MERPRQGVRGDIPPGREQSARRETGQGHVTQHADAGAAVQGHQLRCRVSEAVGLVEVRAARQQRLHQHGGEVVRNGGHVQRR